jgi:hypothetical protein
MEVHMTRSISIHEALAELKLIDKKVESKKRFVLPRLVHTETSEFSWKDPFIEDGGIVRKVESELQAINDLLDNKRHIRVAINQANMENTVEINKRVLSIADWLAWRTEVYPHQLRLLKEILVVLEDAHKPKFPGRQQESTTEIYSHVDASEIQRELEELMSTHERLDGLLSLKNAQILVEVP